MIPLDWIPLSLRLTLFFSAAVFAVPFVVSYAWHRGAALARSQEVTVTIEQEVTS